MKYSHLIEHESFFVSLFASPTNYTTTTTTILWMTSNRMHTNLHNTPHHSLNCTNREQSKTINNLQQLNKPPTHSMHRLAINWRGMMDDKMCGYQTFNSKITRTKSNQRWMKLRTTVQISSAMQKKPPLKREDSFLKRFSTRQIPETQETVEDTGSEGAPGDTGDKSLKRRRRYNQKRRSVVNPDENFHFYWLMVLTICVLYNLWTLIVRQSFPELQVLSG